jgi:Short C-terminal domain
MGWPLVLDRRSGLFAISSCGRIPLIRNRRMFKKSSQGYSRQMNERLVSAEAEGYPFTFGISRRALRIAGLRAVVIAATLAVLIKFRIPSGIALRVLGIILLITYVDSSSGTHELSPAPTKRTKERQVMFGKTTGKKSLAADLALLAELHRSGALSEEEFSAAKRRILDGR